MGQFAYDYESFQRKYAGLEDVLDSQRQEYETKQLGYETERLGWAQAAGRREAAATEASEATFTGLTEELNDPNSIYSHIQSYASDVSSIGALAQSGNMYGAYDKYTDLRTFIDGNRDALSKVASAVPQQGNQFEAGLVKMANSMLSSGFDTHEFILDNGSPNARKATLGEMFRDGETFKRQTDNLARVGISEPVRGILTDMSEENRDRRNLFMQITDPLVAQRESAPNRYQLTDYADYLAKEWNGVVEDIGVDGAQALVNDALGNRISAGTAVDTARTVRSIVRSQLEARPDADRARLVSAAVGQINRLAQHLGQSPASVGQPLPDSMNRFIAKTMQFVAQGASGPVDFDNPDVRRAMEDVTGVFAQAERMDIPLLNEIGEGGADVRKGIADFVSAAMENRPPDDSNIINRIAGSIALNGHLLSGNVAPLTTKAGTDPRDGRGDGAKMFGTTSGSATVDAMRANMWSDLTRMTIPMVASGNREDLALQSIMADPEQRDELVQRWAHSIMVSGGLSNETAQAVATVAVAKMGREDGKLHELDVKETLAEMAFDGGLDESVRGELLRWYKAENLSSEILAPLEQSVIQMIYDPTVGYGAKGKDEVAAYLSRLNQKAVDYLGEGMDPTEIYEKFANTGRYYAPTGRYYLPGNPQAVAPMDDQRYKNAVEALQNNKMTKTQVAAVLETVMREYSQKGYPEMGTTGEFTDLNTIRIPPTYIGGQLIPGLKTGAFRENHETFIQRQRMFEQYYRRMMKEQAAATAAAAKKAATENED